MRRTEKAAIYKGVGKRQNRATRQAIGASVVSLGAARSRLARISAVEWLSPSEGFLHIDRKLRV